MPELWILAGVNGAGKTTLAREPFTRDLLGAKVMLNPDELTARLRAANSALESDAANLQAAVQTTAEVERLVQTGTSFVVETVLSSEKYLDVVRAAKAADYFVGMVYVALASVEYSIARVRERVASGGHDVPEEKLRSRWSRSHDNLAAFFPLLDELYVFDNSSPDGEVVLVAQKWNGALELFVPDALPEVTARLRKFR